MRLIVPLCTALALPLPAFGDPALVTGAVATQTGGDWNFTVTIAHADTGWDDYADGWRIESVDGAVLAIRVLHHPHVDEQPFTRSLAGVELPEGLTQVMIRTRTNVEGWDGAAFGPFALAPAD